MRFTVRWGRRALDALARVWLDYPSYRANITQATAATDQLLQEEPETQGESRDKGRRIVFVLPLAVIFRVDVVRREVRIVDVRIMRTRGGR